MNFIYNCIDPAYICEGQCNQGGALSFLMCYISPEFEEHKADQGCGLSPKLTNDKAITERMQQLIDENSYSVFLTTNTAIRQHSDFDKSHN